MNPQQFNWKSMGTSFEVSVFDRIPEAALASLKTEIIAQSQDFDTTYSRFIKSSLVWKISQKTGKVSVPEDFMGMLIMYFDLYELSEKKLNPLIGFSLSDLGYDENYSFVTKEIIRPVPDLKDTIQIINPSEIFIKEPVLFDFGALGKGYFVDKITQFLLSQGIQHFLVNGSGDMFYSGAGRQGERGITVGLEDPQDAKKVIGTIEMVKGAIACSGTNKRTWGKLHHIINPLSLLPADDLLSVWVTAPSTALADALATCFFFADPEYFREKYQFEYLLLYKNYQIKRSPGFMAEFFT